jgi:3'(2'),5'-bisphosphate nucleotidase
MKKIAITQRLIANDTYFEIREALDIDYAKVLSECGFLPIVLPYEMAFEKYFEEINIEGVFLTGGNDLSSCQENALSEKRDKFEKKLLNYCIKKDIPIFGICRGMQVIAEYFGSTFKEVENQVNVKHSIKVEQDSRYKVYLDRLGRVNSYHQFGIDVLSEELMISAKSEAGIIKALEHKKYKIFGQMWHTEREKPFISNEVALIKDFFDLKIEEIIDIVKDVGIVVMEIYNNKFNIANKEDTSPVTTADIMANELILKRLKAVSIYPIITEESPIAYELRKEWDRFWLVDPLDGTKDFITKNGQFTINIALIEKNRPILGVVHVPATNDTYHAELGKGAYKNNIKIFNSSCRTELLAADSNFHSSALVNEFLEKYRIKNVICYGSSLKICKLAEGEIDVYPRLNGTKEWDTAASHIIANEAGCKLVDILTQKELVYNKEDIRNNFFIASRNNLEFNE